MQDSVLAENPSQKLPNTSKRRCFPAEGDSSKTVPYPYFSTTVGLILTVPELSFEPL
jgi:hypothetical protein